MGQSLEITMKTLHLLDSHAEFVVGPAVLEPLNSAPPRHGLETELTIGNEARIRELPHDGMTLLMNRANSY